MIKRYLIITYIKRPDGKIDETSVVSSYVRKRDLQCGSIILDFKDRAVIKANYNTINIDKDWVTLISYYHQHYESIIDTLFDLHGHKNPFKKETPLNTMVFNGDNTSTEIVLVGQSE